MNGILEAACCRSHFSWWMGYTAQSYSVLPNIESSILGNVKSARLPWVALPF